jgi:hypothetical protein
MSLQVTNFTKLMMQQALQENNTETKGRRETETETESCKSCSHYLHSARSLGKRGVLWRDFYFQLHSHLSRGRCKGHGSFALMSSALLKFKKTKYMIYS